MEGDRLYDDPDLAGFYDIENGWAGDLDYCQALAAGAGSVLDLGCGTGRLAAELAGESRRRVVGVDPAGPMLDIARGRPGGGKVHWVQGDARRLRLDAHFDLVVLTGHAFQVFLTREARAAVLETIARHLAPAGRFVFDSRNPATGEWREWTPRRSERRIEHPAFGPVRAWNDIAQDPATGIVSYGTHYQVIAGGRILSARSRIAFPPREEIAELIGEAGLAVEQWLGDWSGAPWSREAPDIIPLGRPGAA